MQLELGLILAFWATMARAQPHSDADKFLRLTTEVVRDMRTHVDNPDQFKLDGARLRNVVMDFHGDVSPPDQKAANRIAEALIDLYESRKVKFPERASIAADFTSRFGNSEKAKQFVIACLNSNQAGLKIDTETALYWSISLKSDPLIFAELQKLLAKDPSDYLALSAARTLDEVRTISILEKRLADAKDVVTLNKVGSIISPTHNVPLIHRLILRIEEFPVTGHDEFTNPYIGLYSDAIAACIDKTEGKELDFILSRIPHLGAGYEEHLALMRKLSNGKSANSRAAVAKAIDLLAQQGIMVQTDVAEALIYQIAAEKDSVARGAMQKALATIQTKPGSRK